MAPGVVGGISLIVALTALSVLPVNLAGLALLIFGIGLMVAESSATAWACSGSAGSSPSSLVRCSCSIRAKATSP